VPLRPGEKNTFLHTKVSSLTPILKRSWFLLRKGICVNPARSQGHSALAVVALELQAYLPAMEQEQFRYFFRNWPGVTPVSFLKE
jgi:hypothetical protein